MCNKNQKELTTSLIYRIEKILKGSVLTKETKEVLKTVDKYKELILHN